MAGIPTYVAKMNGKSSSLDSSITLASLSSSSPNLKPRSTRKNQPSGTWISSSAVAVLHLLPNPPAIFIVSIRGKNLVSCSASCPMRGSRVIFVSYRHCDSQVQKFALRFSSPRDIHIFLDAVKECSLNILQIGYPRDDSGCENSPQSEYVASNGLLQHRAEESGFTSPNVSYLPEIQASSFQGEEHACAQPPLLANSSDTVFSSLPPSFATLLKNYTAENLEGPGERRAISSKSSRRHRPGYSTSPGL